MMQGSMMNGVMTWTMGWWGALIVVLAFLSVLALAQYLAKK